VVLSSCLHSHRSINTAWEHLHSAPTIAHRTAHARTFDVSQEPWIERTIFDCVTKPHPLERRILVRDRRVYFLCPDCCKWLGSRASDRDDLSSFREHYHSQQCKPVTSPSNCVPALVSQSRALGSSAVHPCLGVQLHWTSDVESDYLWHLHKPGITGRFPWIFPRWDTSSSSLAIDESPGIIASDEFAVGQLFATLMRYGDGAFLAVLECIEIRKAGVSMLANPVPRADLLIPSNNYVLRASVYSFVPTMGSEIHGTQWQWAPSSHVNFRPAGKASMAHDRLDFLVPGFAAVCVAPRLEIYPNSSDDGVVTWTLSGDEMSALAARVYEQVGCDLLNKLPLCGSSTVGTFPYTQLDGKYNVSLLHKRDTESET
jgi:hypothetical protein